MVIIVVITSFIAGLTLWTSAFNDKENLTSYMTGQKYLK